MQKILRLPAVMEATGLSRTTIYRFVADGRFPRQVHLPHTNSVGWREGDVSAWLQSAELDPELALAAKQKAAGATAKAHANARCKQASAAV